MIRLSQLGWLAAIIAIWLIMTAHDARPSEWNAAERTIKLTEAEVAACAKDGGCALISAKYFEALRKSEMVMRQQADLMEKAIEVISGLRSQLAEERGKREPKGCA